MANQLNVAKLHSILTLRERGWSHRRIARELGVHRETVARYLSSAGPGSKPAKAPPGSNGDCGPLGPVSLASKPAKAPLGSRSDCERFRPQILAMLEQGLSATRVHQDLRAEHGSGAPSAWSVKRFVRALGQSQPLPMRRMECEPGVECQVDLGGGAPIDKPDGRCRRPHVLRVVLSHSRKGYSEVLLRQSTEEFIRALENAFWYFGGVPQTLVLDNLRAAVKKADWFDPELNPKVQSFCEHYGIVALPCKPYMPRHKGKVERGIGYVKDNGLKGHRFTSVQAENQHLLDWETTVADTRIHGTTRKQVGKVFQEVERPALQPLPTGRFPFFHEGKRSVHRDGHVEVDKSYYSVPPEYMGRRLWVRWDVRLVRIFNERMEQIDVHAKREPGQFSTHPHHVVSEKINGVERGAVWLLKRASRIGTHSHRWAQAMLEARGIQGVRVLMGLLSLANRHSYQDLERACETALSHRAFRLRTIRALIKRHGPAQEQFEFIQDHPIIRDMSEYGLLVTTPSIEEPHT